MTFAELKMHLDSLTPEQLATEATWSGDERGMRVVTSGDREIYVSRGGKIKQFWIAEEDWIGTSEGDCGPRSAFDSEDAASGDLIIPHGTPQLLVD